MAIEASSRNNGAQHKITSDAKASKARTHGFGGLADAGAGMAGDFMAIFATLETLETQETQETLDTKKAADFAVRAGVPEWTPTLTDTNAAMGAPTDTSMVFAQASLVVSVGTRATMPTDLPDPLSTADAATATAPAPAPAQAAFAASVGTRATMPTDLPDPLSTADAATATAPAQAAFAASVGARATMPMDVPVSTTVADAHVTPPAAAASAADAARAAMPTDTPVSISMAMRDTNAATQSSPSHRFAEETPDDAQTEPEANPVVVGADTGLNKSVNVPLNAALPMVSTQTPPTQSLRSSFLAPPRLPARIQTLSNANANGVVSPSEVPSQVASELVAEPGRNLAKNAQADASARLTQGHVPMQAPATDPGTSHGRHVLDFIQKLVDLPDLSVNLQPTAFAMLATPTATRRDDRLREQSVFKTYADDASPLSQSMMVGPTDTLTAGAAEAVPSTDAYVAEQVSYWISNGVQNAELKLDDLGNNPVEVSIRMHGNEAHVTFRTDELQTRTALENASLHLKNLLQSEGVILSGVSVGTTGSGGPGNQQQQSQQRPRQFTTALVSPGHSGLDGLDSMARRVTKNTLDLFV